ncbi:hypothetical protein [Chromobacterium phragmitis]|uniref:hypothetical protein n=1 Tax=Chromobacterium phragmitis TaxID=2202141 RepID=UPI001F204543|nr:hypothetical protein [Chromobacterium phragmitis]
MNPPPVVQSANAIQSVTSDPPATCADADAVAEAPKGPVSAKGNCSGAVPDYPAKALEDEVQGVVSVVFTVGADGKFNGFSNVGFDGGIPPRYRSSFKSAISAALQGYTCRGSTSLTQEFSFKLDSGS